MKLTNTLESLNTTHWLPTDEKMVYTSGRALHPISINLASKLQKDFDGKCVIMTGGTGSIGSQVLTKLLKYGAKVVVLAQDPARINQALDDPQLRQNSK